MAVGKAKATQDKKGKKIENAKERKKTRGGGGGEQSTMNRFLKDP